MGKTRLHGLLPLIGTLLADFSVTHAYPQSASAKAAVALDPVDGIIAAFKTHTVVALGEGDHTNEQGHALRLKLIRDPRLAKVANDIVVEFGNSRYQDAMDQTASQCADPEYMQTRIGRMKSAGPYCSSPAFTSSCDSNCTRTGFACQMSSQY